MERSTVRRIYVLGLWFFVLSTTQFAVAQSAPTGSDVAGYTGLHKAAYEGDVETLMSLIKSGVDLEVRDGSGRTALHVAAFASHESIVAVLAESGANMNSLEFQAYDIVTIAAVANDIEVLTIALNQGASAGNVTSPYDGTALIAAAHLGHHRVVDRLIKSKAPLDHVNNLNWTALIEAVVLGDGGTDHQKTVKLLLVAGADQAIGDGQGVSPLAHAQSRGYAEMVRLFMEHQP